MTEDDTEIIKIFIAIFAESRSSFKYDKNCGIVLTDGNIPQAVEQVSNFRDFLSFPNAEIVDGEW